MRLLLVVAITLVGVLATSLAAWRAWSASRRSDANRDIVIGYLAVMVVVAVASTLLLRLL